MDSFDNTKRHLSYEENKNLLVNSLTGVGPAKAEKILEVFPNMNGFSSLYQDFQLLEKLNKVFSPSFANNIKEQIEKIQKNDEKTLFMINCGIPAPSASEIVKNPLEYEAFTKDPYAVGKNHNIDFALCDKFAHAYRWEETSPDYDEPRMKAFIEAMLLELEASGHTYATLKQLTNRMNRYQRNYTYYPVSYTPSHVLLYIDDPTMFHVDGDMKNPDAMHVFRKSTYDLENDIAYHVRRLSKGEELESTEKGTLPKGIRYDEIQLNAIKSCDSSGLKIITGPPGSGKTAVINGIIHYYKSKHPDKQVVMCAPTGRAAKHIVEITGEKASTIHRLLGINGYTKKREDEKLDAGLVVCDEASMLNLDITFELLSRIQSGTVVYFVGDKDQLPAVGPGNVLHDIINSEIVPVYHLTKVYRQDGTILENAHRINAGKTNLKQDGVFTVKRFDSAEDLKKVAIERFLAYYDEDTPFETQILIPSYKTECGIDAVNLAVQALNPELFSVKGHSPKACFKKNDKILMVKNDPHGQYQNGSVGMFIASTPDGIRVNFEGEEMVLPKTALNDMTLGYAVSVHKAQGSEYDNVIICLPEKPSSMLKRNIIYTAVTRAKKNCWILYVGNSLNQSILTHEELFMQTRLMEKLKAFKKT